MGEREYTIEQRMPNGDLRLSDTMTNDCIVLPELSLIDELFAGKLEIPGDNRSYIGRKADRSLTQDFTQMPEDLKSEAKRRYAYIMAAFNEGLDKWTESSLAPLIESVGKKIEDRTPPDWITLFRWLKNFVSSGKDLRSLVPLQGRKGNRKRKISSEVAALIDKVIAERYLTPQRLSVRAIYDTLIVYIDDENRFREPIDQLSIPHKTTVYRIVSKLDPYEKTSARFGKRIADYKFRTVKKGMLTTRPLERVEMDHTKLDLFVIDEERGLPIGRPLLATAIDAHTKSVVGVYVSFDPPSYLSVMQCIRHAITPKTYVKVKFPNIKNTWDCYGVMETVVVDNAKENYSTHMEDACLQLGIIIQYAPVKLAWYKGSVERYFGTINKQLLHQQPGTTFSNIFEKADYNPRKNAIITFDVLLEIIHKWIIDVYHQQEHRGIRNTPAQAWKVGVEQFPPALPPSKKEIDVLLGMIGERTISPSGIELHGLLYNGDCLRALGRGVRRDKVKVKFDPTDLSVIHVFDKFRGLFVPVSAVNQTYTRDLSLWQHRVIQNYARQRIKEHVNIVALARAKDEIQNIVREGWETVKRTASRQRMGRFKKIGQHEHKELLSLESNTISMGEQKVQLDPRRNLSRTDEESLSLKGLSEFGKSSQGGEQLEDSLASKKTSENSLEAKPQNLRRKKFTAPIGQASESTPAKGRKAKASSSITGEEDAGLDMTGWSSGHRLPK
jgi:putative transposase